jgi:hypothetical protein
MQKILKGFVERVYLVPDQQDFTTHLHPGSEHTRTRWSSLSQSGCTPARTQKKQRKQASKTGINLTMMRQLRMQTLTDIAHVMPCQRLGSVDVEHDLSLYEGFV